MKKLITLSLILLPMLSMAQKEPKKTDVKGFFDKYSETKGYSSMEVTEDMFKMFSEVEEAEDEMINFLKKLKFVRMLEFNPRPVTVTGVSTRRGKTTSTVSTGGTAGVKATGVVASEGSNIAPVHSMVNSMLYDDATNEINLSSYKQLMKTNDDGEKLIFLRKHITSNPNDQEFLLITGNTLINIRGDINIKHLYELEDILDMVGEILPQ